MRVLLIAVIALAALCVSADPATPLLPAYFKYSMASTLQSVYFQGIKVHQLAFETNVYDITSQVMQGAPRDQVMQFDQVFWNKKALFYPNYYQGSWSCMNFTYPPPYDSKYLQRLGTYKGTTNLNGVPCYTFATHDSLNTETVDTIWYIPVEGGIDPRNTVQNVKAISLNSTSFGHELDEIIHFEVLDSAPKGVFVPDPSFGCNF